MLIMLDSQMVFRRLKLWWRQQEINKRFNERLHLKDQTTRPRCQTTATKVGLVYPSVSLDRGDM